MDPVTHATDQTISSICIFRLPDARVRIIVCTTHLLVVERYIIYMYHDIFAADCLSIKRYPCNSSGLLAKMLGALFRYIYIY